MKSERIMFVGPQRYPVTGQSEAFDMLLQSRREGESFVHFPHNRLSFATLRFVGRILRCVWTVQPTVVYLSISRSGPGFLRDALVIWLSVLAGARVVVHLHGADFDMFLATANRILAWAVRKSYGRVSAAIVLVEQMKAEFRAFPGLPVYSISNGVSKEVESAALNFERRESNSEQPLKVLFLSNLIASKGILELIAAVEQLQSEGIAVELDICGRNGFSPDVDAKVVQTSDRFRFHGVVKGEEKLRFLKDSDVVALPSYYHSEAQPISLIEGLHFGCSLVFTDHNYLPDFLSEDFGICVPPRKIEAIAAALRLYATNRDLLQHHGHRGREAARSGFTQASHCAGVRAALRATTC